MPEYTKKIVYLSDAQYQELITNKSITVNGVTVNYDKNMIYMTPQNTPLYAEDLAEWAKASTKPNYTAVEVGALPSDTHIPTTTAELTNDAGFITSAAVPTKISDLTDDSGHYTKPATGIPASDLSEEIVSTIDAKAPAIWEDASGDIVTFADGAEDMPLRECVVSVDPVQDLHGYDNPWPAGGNVNLLPPGVAFSVTDKGITFTSDGNGKYTMFGTSTESVGYDFDIPEVTLPNTVYIHLLNNVASSTLAFAFKSGNTQIAAPTLNTVDRIYNGTEVLGGQTVNKLRLYVNGAQTINVTLTPMALATSSSATFSPYSNICPITGWTGATISHSGADTTDPDEISITFPTEAGTVYGGTLDVTNGVLTVNRAKITLDGTQLIGISNWRPYDGSSAWLYTPNITPDRINTMGKIGAICDLLKEIPYGSSDAPSGTPHIYGGECGISSVGSNLYGLAIRVPVSGLTNNSLINAWLNNNPIAVVYPLSTPITYILTPQEIRTLLGENNIWADTGDTSVTYTADTKTFIEQNTPESPVQDVQVNGTSVVTDGVANVPLATKPLTPYTPGAFGVMRIGNMGVTLYDNTLCLDTPSDAMIKQGTTRDRAITVFCQDKSTFYGLAKAAGADMKDIANTTVGTYPDTQKEAIQSMLGITQMLAPENPNLVASQAYSIGDVFAANGHLYKATVAIAQDEAIIPDTNCVETTMVDAGGKIKDVQVNGSTIVDNGVANVPIASANKPGTVIVGNAGGLYINPNTGVLMVAAAQSNEIRYGTQGFNYKPITPAMQKQSVFYGLAQAAGVDTSQDTLAIGQYTDSEQTAIKAMLGVQDGLKVVRLI